MAISSVKGTEGLSRSNPSVTGRNPEQLPRPLPKVNLPQPTQTVQIPKKNVSQEVDLQKFTKELKAKFKQLENMPSFPPNLMVKLDVGLEFGVFGMPEQLFSKLVEDGTNETLKLSPPEFLLVQRVMLERFIGDPAFSRVIKGMNISLSA